MSPAARRRAKEGNSSASDFLQAGIAADFLRRKSRIRPLIALVLGSGLGAFADEFADAARIPYAKIPFFPRSTAIGHAGNLVLGRVDGVDLLAMQGRVHLYEGYTAKQVAFPVRVFARLGVKAIILTNAAGGIKGDFTQGRLVTITDHINLQGDNPLRGANEEKFGQRFPDMTAAYDKAFRAAAIAQARRLGIDLGEGVYAALAGPSYETPAEIRFLRTIGADLVGMSTVPEVLAARHSGLRVLGISCVTNAAAGILDEPLDHHEVLATSERVKSQFIGLLRAVIPAIVAGL